MSSDVQQETPWVEWVATGQQNSKEGPYIMFFPVGSDGRIITNSELLLFRKKSFKHIRCGSIYKLQAGLRDDGTMSCFPGTAMWQRLYPDAEKRAEWQMLWDAAEIEQARVRLEKKETGIKEWRETLQPIKRAYQRTNWQNQRAIEVLVLDYLRRYDDDL